MRPKPDSFAGPFENKVSRSRWRREPSVLSLAPALANDRFRETSHHPTAAPWRLVPSRRSAAACVSRGTLTRAGRTQRNGPSTGYRHADRLPHRARPARAGRQRVQARLSARPASSAGGRVLRREVVGKSTGIGLHYLRSGRFPIWNGTAQQKPPVKTQRPPTLDTDRRFSDKLSPLRQRAGGASGS